MMNEDIKMVETKMLYSPMNNNSQNNLLGILGTVVVKPLKAIRQFQDIFLYGISMNILHKGRSKQFYIYLDNNRQKFIWISSKTKAFLFDLYFTSVHISQNGTRIKNKTQYYVTLKQFQDQATFIFSEKEEQSKYFDLFTIYIEQLRKVNPKYTQYFSLITRNFALQSIKKGSNTRSETDVIQISSKIGLANKRDNQLILNQCCKYHKVTDKKQIPFQCVNQYFKIQFCSRKLQKYFQQYSQQKLGQIEKNPRLILKEIMSRYQFRNFLRKQQKQDQATIQALSQGINNLSFFDFCLYIYDKNLCSINKHPPLDQNYPLNDYFCYSSHNTYLSGNQLTSDCQVERYTQDLQNGIKCVQLDVHNDGYTPIVTHAVKDQSLCKPIFFADVIKQVDRFSEQNLKQQIVHFPIILSIQNHATQQNRQSMLNMLSTMFNKNLFYVQDTNTKFPTLKQLRGKIIIKTSSKQNQLKKVQLRSQHGIKLSQTFKLPQFRNQYIQDGQEFSKKFKNFNKHREELIQRKNYFDQNINSIQNLFLPISSMAKVTSIFKAQKGIKTQNPSSFVCTSLTNVKAQSKKPQVIIKYSKGSWLRTYPQASEVGSGNYDPASMLNVGAQIIALNTQTKDDYAWMMFGYFSGAKSDHPGQKGYVLKPQRLRTDQNREQKKRNIEIKVIEKNSHKLKVKFYGVGNDKQKVKINDDTFIANSIQKSDQSFVIYEIDDQYKQCVALRFIQPGFRILIGRNKDNYLDVGVRIVVHVKIQ